MDKNAIALANLALANTLVANDLLVIVRNPSLPKPDRRTMVIAANTIRSFVVGGSNTQVQFNDSNVFGGNANLTFNKSTSVLTVGNSSINVSINSVGFSIGANLIGNTSSIFIGNSSFNSVINSTSAKVSGNVFVGNDSIVANLYVSGHVIVGNATITISTNVISISVGSSNTFVYMGATPYNDIGFRVVNNDNTAQSLMLDSGFSVGNSTVNNALMNTSGFFVGNSTVNSSGFIANGNVGLTANVVSGGNTFVIIGGLVISVT